jgi:dolichyl-phosphate-mannose--protein O-mannosyl transferase
MVKRTVKGGEWTLLSLLAIILILSILTGYYGMKIVRARRQGISPSWMHWAVTIGSSIVLAFALLLLIDYID